MALQPDKIIMCPICLETMKPPIVQCQRGHSMCADCKTANRITICPQCRDPMSNVRSLQLEQLIESMQKCMKFPCFFANKGCKIVTSSSEKEDHESECRFRLFYCEGHTFAKWNCSWRGDYKQIEGHFRDAHRHNISMQYKTEAHMKMCLDADFLDVQIISFFNGSQYFYYKLKVDVAKQKVYWVFQIIGTKKQAHQYYYEFEVHNGPIRKFKVTEFCENDTADINKIFNEEKCVCMSFAAVKSYLNDKGELPFKFRLMSVKDPKLRA